MKAVSLIQGSPEWLAHRAKTRNASDAPAMMGASPYVSRAELVKRYATGIQPDVDAATQRIFDRGHAVEPALRARAESIIGEDLYPVTAISDDGYLGASFDGVTMDGLLIFEAKQWNAEKAELVGSGEIPPVDAWQVAQQFAVCQSAECCLYMVGDGSDERTVWMFIDRDAFGHMFPRLLAGWAQFDADVAAYQPEAAPAAVVAAPVAGFGALSMRVEGRVLASNLDSFRADAEAFIARLPKPADLQDDQDFADAESAVKACSEAEARIKAAKDAALAQMSDVDAVLRAADDVAETIRAARLALDRAVKAEKETRKSAIVRAGVDAVRGHYACINASLGEYAIGVPASLTADIGASIKGLKSLSSMREKIDAAVAQAKIDASQEADRRRLSIAVVEQYAEHRGLLPDAAALVATKSPDDLRNLIVARIAEHRRPRDAERAQVADAKSHGAMGNAPQAVAAPNAAAPAYVGTAPTAATGAASRSASPIRLGQINAAIAPMSITADGLAQLGIKPVGKDRAAVLFAGDAFDRIRAALIERLTAARIASTPEAA